jgi:hypothetical protein
MILKLATIAALLPSVVFAPFVFAADQASPQNTPVLVELFTSEGCSSCPPADAYLRQLDEQPIPGAQIIVLSEHVDYWDHLGWRDIYSSHELTERQNAYAAHFGLSSSYTPQMVIDGTKEVVGSNTQAAQEILIKSSKNPKLAVHILDAKVDPDGSVRARLEVPALQESSQKADVYVALALNRAVSQVKRGENTGREISHVAVVRQLVRVGSVGKGGGFHKDIRLRIRETMPPDGLRLIAFLQSPGPGVVLGAAAVPLK